LFLEMPATLDFCVVATDVVDRRQGAAFRNALTSPGYMFTHSSETLLLNANAPQMFDDRGNGLFSTVLLDWIEWEGPLVSEEETSRSVGLVPPNEATPEVVAEHLQRFAERAWRRPVKNEELVEFLKSYRAEREAGEKTVDAYRVALQGVMTSRHFIYLVEGAPEARDRVSEWELASRLSYFLWSSMPDAGLVATAQGGKLHDEGLSQEVDRMLMDRKVGGFIDDFARQWLQLHRLGMFPPDKKLYPNYDAWLETSMRAEPIEYFREMFTKNVTIDSFIDSDWTMANARLADFYGYPEMKAGGFQRVSLKPEDHRGGLLTMGAVLGLTSDGTRHRPVHRGVWPQGNAPRQTGSAPQRRELCGLPCQDRPFRTGLGQLRRHRSMADTRERRSRSRRGSIDQSRRRDARWASVQGCERFQRIAARRPRPAGARLHRASLYLRPSSPDDL
jgi:Protein of unknown function (DUF1592)/Protein of unknown function (DUF1595)